MRKLLLITFLFSFVLANAQKIDKDNVDKFSGHRTITTTQELVFPSTFKKPTNLWFHASAGVGESGIEIVGLHFALDVESSVFKGNKLLLLFDDGSKAEIEAIDSYTLDHFYAKARGSVKKTKWFGMSPSYYMFKGDKELESLLTKTVTDIRIETRKGYVTFEISDKGYEKMKTCIELCLDKLSK